MPGLAPLSLARPSPLLSLSLLPFLSIARYASTCLDIDAGDVDLLALLQNIPVGDISLYLSLSPSPLVSISLPLFFSFFFFSLLSLFCLSLGHNSASPCCGAAISRSQSLSACLPSLSLSSPLSSPPTQPLPCLSSPQISNWRVRRRLHGGQVGANMSAEWALGPKVQSIAFALAFPFPFPPSLSPFPPFLPRAAAQYAPPLRWTGGLGPTTPGIPGVRCRLGGVVKHSRCAAPCGATPPALPLPLRPPLPLPLSPPLHFSFLSMEWVSLLRETVV